MNTGKAGSEKSPNCFCVSCLAVVRQARLIAKRPSSAHPRPGIWHASEATQREREEAYCVYTPRD